MDLLTVYLIVIVWLMFYTVVREMIWWFNADRASRWAFVVTSAFVGLMFWVW